MNAEGFWDGELAGAVIGLIAKEAQARHSIYELRGKAQNEWWANMHVAALDLCEAAREVTGAIANARRSPAGSVTELSDEQCKRVAMALGLDPARVRAAIRRALTSSTPQGATRDG